MMRHYDELQQGVVKHWYGSFSSVLEQQEGIITLMGKTLLLQQRERNVQNDLDEIMALNPEIFAGFALISTAGEVLELTSNLQSDNLPNLSELPQTRDSFGYAMTTDKMVLGRTYNAPRLVVPARKAIYDKDGQLLGVMTGALKFGSEDGLFGRTQVLGDFNRITILRERDHYIQYATNGQPLADFYSEPMPAIEYERLLAAMKMNRSFDFLHARDSGQALSFERISEDGRGTVRGVALYNERYEFWLISEIEESFFIYQFMHVFAGYLFIMVMFQLAMFFLFRSIDRSEKKQRSVLEFQANHDPLTQLPNRNFLLSKFEEWRANKTEFSLLFVDLDNFKGINDSFGHKLGDELLVRLASRLQKVIQSRDLLIRHGGDEFVMLISDERLEAAENLVANRIFSACENIDVQQKIFSPGVSIGIAHFPQHGQELDELMRAADIAMYDAKRKRNTVRIFQPDLEGKYLLRARIEQLLRGAEKRGEIYMNYQPQVDSSGRLHGVEALVRWNPPELGFVPPDQFVAVAEHSGQMTALGDFIIDNALQEIADIQSSSGRSFCLSLNISVKQLSEPDFADKLQEKIVASGLAFVNVVVEITENILIDDVERMRAVLEQIHAQGIRISLDDFGTGYSSLSLLRHLPLDEIKIDKSFVDHLIEDETALRMARNIVAIGRNYNVTLVAEGVETEAQLECLNQIGCDLYQGYYFSRPLSAEALRCFLDEHPL